MGTRIFATSDNHLGMKFASYGEAREALSEARFGTLDRLVQRTGSFVSLVNQRLDGLYARHGRTDDPLRSTHRVWSHDA